MKLKQHLPSPDYVILGLVFALLTFGFIALSSASTALSYERFGNNNYYLIRQLLYGLLPGGILMYILSRVNYKFWQSIAPLAIFVGIGLLLAVLMPHIGFKVGNSRRWINFGAFLFQPAEYVKLAVIFYLASWYDRRQQHVHDLYYGFLPMLAIVGLISLLIVFQPDLGSMLSLMAIAICMFFVGGVKLKHLISTGLAGLAAMWLLIKIEPYRLERITTFFNPSHDTQGISYQISQALIAIGSGGIWGLGVGQSIQTKGYLPEPMGDSIFAVMSEELGFIRICIILALVLFFAWRGYKIATKTPDTFGKMVAAGITSWIVFQSLINIGGITAIIPLTGIPLPFISYGSTALAINLGAIGILLNISRFADLKQHA
jgi:cell division protein FtsW